MEWNLDGADDAAETIEENAGVDDKIGNEAGPETVAAAEAGGGACAEVNAADEAGKDAVEDLGNDAVLGEEEDAKEGEDGRKDR